MYKWRIEYRFNNDEKQIFEYEGYTAYMARECCYDLLDNELENRKEKFRLVNLIDSKIAS